MDFCRDDLAPESQGNLVTGMGFCCKGRGVGYATFPGYFVHSDIPLGLRGQALQWSIIVLMTLRVGAKVEEVASRRAAHMA